MWENAFVALEAEVAGYTCNLFGMNTRLWFTVGRFDRRSAKAGNEHLADGYVSKKLDPMCKCHQVPV